MSTPADPSRGSEIQKRVQATVKHDDHTSWDLCWKQKVTPWDTGSVQPSLVETIEESGIAFPRSGRALVPGCGTGYDVLYLASLGLDAFGMDVSETAVEAANKYRDSQTIPGSGSAVFLKKDFFTVDFPEAERFDLVIDHTFFCAIPPTLRGDWGKRMAAFIKPGGYLITDCYPMHPKVDIGPPYYLRPEHYDGPLEDNFEKIYDQVPKTSSESHKDKERIIVWKRK